MEEGETAVDTREELSDVFGVCLYAALLKRMILFNRRF